MIRLGLTGSIATGKSTVLEMFRARDIPVYSADEAVHALYAGDAVAEVGALFPGVTVNGAVDRARLSKKLLETPDGFAKLEALVHPLVRQKMLAFLDEAEAAGADLAVLEIPLLYETGHPYPLDAVAVVSCADAEQRRRALARAGMSVEKLDAILARQVPQAEKRLRADFVISTDGPEVDTAAEVDQLLTILRKRAADNA